MILHSLSTVRGLETFWTRLLWSFIWLSAGLGADVSQVRKFALHCDWLSHPNILKLGVPAYSLPVFHFVGDHFEESLRILGTSQHGDTGVITGSPLF